MMDGCSFQIKICGLVWWCLQSIFERDHFWLYHNNTSVKLCVCITLILLPHDDWTVNSMPANQFKKLKNARKKKKKKKYFFFSFFYLKRREFPTGTSFRVPQFSPFSTEKIMFLLANLSLSHVWHKTVKKRHATIE